MKQGWIKLHRQLLESDMWENLSAKQKVVMDTCLLLANHKEKEWEFQGEICNAKPGQFITSYSKLAEKCKSGISIRNVRTALSKLEKWQFLTRQSSNKSTKITIINWHIYQGNEHNDRHNNRQTTDKQLTSNRQTTDKQTDKLTRMIKNY